MVLRLLREGVRYDKYLVASIIARRAWILYVWWVARSGRFVVKIRQIAIKDWCIAAASAQGAHTAISIARIQSFKSQTRRQEKSKSVTKKRHRVRFMLGTYGTGRLRAPARTMRHIAWSARNSSSFRRSAWRFRTRASPVILDSHDKPWILTVAAITTVGGVSYLAYAAAKPAGPSGGTWPGLIYGIIGTLLMSFSGLLGARKKVPTLRIGRVHWWMRGHVWLGLLSFPMILFHAGFSMGGPLTYVLMILFMMILLSGIIGLILQQFMPRFMMDQVPVGDLRAGDDMSPSCWNGRNNASNR